MCISNYNPDVIARNVKQLGNGVIEVRRYNDGHIRADLSWVWFLCSIGFMLYDYFTTQTLFRDVQWAISVDWALEDNWKWRIESFTELGKEIPENYYNEFKIGMIKNTGQEFIGAGSTSFSRCSGSLWSPRQNGVLCDLMPNDV